jgi:quercetin dioxygenase-like cupin family protein
MAEAQTGARYGVERRARHEERPGFWISELQIGLSQQVPWHRHSAIQDTFYVVEGRIRLAMRDPEQEVVLNRGETFTIPPGRPHRVTNAGEASATFLNLQGFGDYDFIPES